MALCQWQWGIRFGFNHPLPCKPEFVPERARASNKQPPRMCAATALLSLMMTLAGLRAAAAGAAESAAENITALDPRLLWVGRRVEDAAKGSVAADWEGVEVRLRVNNGTESLRALIAAGEFGGQRYNVWVRSTATGHAPVRVSSFWPEPGTTQWYTVISGYSLQYDAEVHIQRSVEPLFADTLPGANTRFLGFASSGGFAAAPARAARRIEFFGDSITAALGNLGTFSTGCWGSPFMQDYAASYAHLLCLAFDAECATLAWSGISLAVRKTGPKLPGCPGGQCVLPDLLPWSLPTYAGNSAYMWNASSWVPHLAHINLGTNDQAGNFSNATFLAEFEAAYVDFAHAISAFYGDTQAKAITFALGWGPMSSSYSGAVAAVAASLEGEGYRVLTLDYNVADYSPVGCEYHPSASVDAAMAAQVRPAIAAKMGWTT